MYDIDKTTIEIVQKNVFKCFDKVRKSISQKLPFVTCKSFIRNVYLCNADILESFERLDFKLQIFLKSLLINREMSFSYKI